MQPFSARDAWSSGIRFLSDQAAAHAIILIGVGILAPFALQYLLIGHAVGILGQAGAEALAGTAGGVAAAAAMAGYALQFGSYFASWRLGFGRDESLGGAILFGLLAGLLVVVGFALVGGAVAFFLIQVAPVLGPLLAGIAALVLLAFVATTITALLAVSIAAIMLLAIAFGAVTGNMGFAANLVGGSGGVAVLLIVFAGLLLWLAARLSCAMPMMAERKSFNLLAAIAESRHLTLSEGWLVLRYLGLLGLAMALLAFAALVAIGVGLAAGFGAEGAMDLSDLGIGAELIAIAVAIPVAYLTVLVPAGIYRELAGSPAPVEVFA